jgi:hypothetical protein
MKKIFTFSLFIIIIISLSTEDIFSIPAFARKYKMSCKTCHAPIPKLKAYGNDFAANGFVLKDKDAPRYYVKTGDEDLSLLREVPLAIRFEGYLTYNIRNYRFYSSLPVKAPFRRFYCKGYFLLLLFLF